MFNQLTIKMANYACSVPNCLVKKNKDLSVFCLPSSQKTRQKWLKFLRDRGKNITDENARLRICEFHFSSKDIYGGEKRKKLKPGSIPIFYNNAVIQMNLLLTDL
jgi:hypothetical protein